MACLNAESLKLRGGQAYNCQLAEVLENDNQNKA